MASRLFQTVIYQMQSALSGKMAGVIDETGTIIASSEITMIGKVWENVANVANETNETIVVNNICFKRLGGRSRAGYVVFCEGSDETAKGFVGIICVSLTQLKQFYDEKYDKISFIKNILIDNIMAGDVYVKAKALHINTDVFRIALLIRTHGDEFAAHEVVNGLFPDKIRDFVISINETDVVLIKEVREDIPQKELETMAHTIVDTLGSELMANVTIGIGSIVSTISEIGHSYKDACVALEVGKVFDNERSIISYNNLGIGRLIYQLPTKLCELFLTEVFRKGSLDLLDDETIITIQKFFENNLNVSEASRQLFVHRNTLVYRLDKIHKLTGLDLRRFDDAIVFKVAMMVNRYLNSDTINI